LSARHVSGMPPAVMVEAHLAQEEHTAGLQEWSARMVAMQVECAVRMATLQHAAWAPGRSAVLVE